MRIKNMQFRQLVKGNIMRHLIIHQVNIRSMSNNQRTTKDWIQAVASYMNLSPSELGKRSGVAPSTITRFLYDETGTIGISQRTLEQLARFSGVPVHRLPKEDVRTGLPATDASPLDDSELLPAALKAAINVFLQEHEGSKAWLMKGWPLELMGVLPGDILIIDETKRPKVGDIVFAKVSDWSHGTSEAVFRLYQPPYIISYSSRIGPQKPLAVDEDAVSLKGVCVAVLRATR